MAKINWAVVKLILKGWYRAIFFSYDQNLNLSIDRVGVEAKISLRLNENSDIEQQQQPMEIDSNNESQHHNRKKAGNSNRKVSSVWIIPYLVRNLKFLQSKVLKVSSEILEGGNWSKAGGNIDFTIFFKKRTNFCQANFP